jgi:flagellar motor switch protein FliG
MTDSSWVCAMSMSHSRLSAPQLRATAVATVLDSKRTGLLSGEIAADLAELWVKQILGASDVQRRAISFACDDFINRYVVANQQAHVVDALAGGLAPADASIEDGEIRQSSVHRNNKPQNLVDIGDDVLAGYVKAEYPQTAAAILSIIDTNTAGRIIRQLSNELAFDMLNRLTCLEAIKPDFRHVIEAAIASEAHTPFKGAARKSTSKMVASILNNLDAARSVLFLESLRSKSMELADQLEAHMFTFSDFLSLPGDALQIVLASVDKELLCLSLKGTPKEQRSRITSLMPARAAKAFEALYQDIGRAKIKDINAARNQLLAFSRDLASQGLIDIDRNNEDQVVDE